ncbi:unnamed protein product, partial [marine sediment metagenome]
MQKTRHITSFEDLIAQATEEASKYKLGPSLDDESPDDELKHEEERDRAILLISGSHYAFAYWEVTQFSM